MPNLLLSNAAVALRKNIRDEDDVGGQVAAPQRNGDSPRAGRDEKQVRASPVALSSCRHRAPVSACQRLLRVRPHLLFAERAKYHYRHAG
jgi:hypothetical protein